MVSDDWPLSGLTGDVRPALARALRAGEPAVLATLAAADSGAPLGEGAQLLFTRADYDQLFALLRPAATDLVHAYQASQGLTAQEATQAAGVSGGTASASIASMDG